MANDESMKRQSSLPALLVSLILLSGLLIQRTAWAQEGDWEYALRRYAQAGDMKHVQELLDRGINIDAASKSGETALMQAARQGHVSMVRLLLRRGANVNQEDTTHTAALEWGCMSGNKEIVKLLFDRTPNIRVRENALITAALWSKPAIAQFLLDKGVAVDSSAADSWCGTALLAACTRTDMRCIRLLAQRGANVNATDESGRTPLIVAAEANYVPAIKFLLSRGAEVNRKDKQGGTALSSSKTSRMGATSQSSVIRLLQQAGATE